MTENKHYNYKEPEYIPASQEDEEQGIDWMEIIHQIISIRKKLYKATGIGLILGIIIAFSIPKQYTVNVTLSPEMGNGKSSSGLAGLAASFLGGGVSMDSPDALNASLSPDIVTSTPFLLELLNAKVITQNKDLDSTFTVYLDKQRLPWWGYIFRLPKIAIKNIKSFLSEEELLTHIDSGTIEITEEEAEKLKILREQITAEVDNKTAITTITVTLQDPKVTATIADSVITKLQKYITTYRTRKAKEDCSYLETLYKERQQEYFTAQQRYASYVDANNNIVFQSNLTERERLQNEMNLTYQVYSQVAQQLQVARAKVQEEKPVFAVVEPAVVPLEPSSTSRKIIILVIMIIIITGVGIWNLYGKKYWQKFNTNIRNIE